jgi:hypothetical protein
MQYTYGLLILEPLTSAICLCLSWLITFYTGMSDTTPRTSIASKKITSESITAISMDTKQAFVTPSAELALIKEYPPIQFVNVKQMSEMV